MNEKLKDLRKYKNCSQKDVANSIGITVSAYSNYEQGLRTPSVDIIILLCRFYDVSADYLLGLE